MERRGLYYSDPRPLVGTFNGLIESGDLRLIRDPEVRQAIVAYVPQITSDRAEFDRWVDTFIQRLIPWRDVVVSLPDYEQNIAGGAVAAFSTFPVDPALQRVLDGAIWSNEVRLIYLRRMLEATEITAEALSER